MLNRLLPLFVTAFLLWFPSGAGAFSVAPGTMEMTGARGEVIQTEFSLINTDAAPRTYFLGTMKFVPRDNGGSPEFISPDVDFTGFPEWVSYPASSVTVPANSVVAVPVTFAIPMDVASGGHYGALTVSDAPYEIVETNGTTVNARVAILVFLTVQGETVEKIALLDFQTPIAGRVLSRLSGSWTYRIQNQGNVHVTPSASITVEDVFGRSLLAMDANETDGRVLPGSTRTFEGAFGTQEEEGFFASVKSQVVDFAIGPLTATLTLEENGQFVTESVNFWIVPWQLLSVVALCVLAIALAAFAVRPKKK